jgi:phosphatidylglycerophosphate synthase
MDTASNVISTDLELLLKMQRRLNITVGIFMVALITMFALYSFHKIHSDIFYSGIFVVTVIQSIAALSIISNFKKCKNEIKINKK